MHHPNSSIVSKTSLSILLFVLVAVLIAFLPCLKNGFVNFDDETMLLSNPEVLSLDVQNLKTIFAFVPGKAYIPLTTLSFALEHHFFDFQPLVYHLNNVLLHLMVVGLIFFLGLRLGLGVWACGLASLIFGIHPMHVESVAWVAERKDVLYSVFYLAALHTYWSYLEKYQKRFWILTFVFGLLSMLAKPMALSLPLILLILDGMKGRRWTIGVFAEKIPHGFYIVPIALMIYKIDAAASPVPLMESVLTFFWSASFYLWKFFWPVSLAPIYSRPEPVIITNPVYPAAVVSVLVFAFLLIRFRHHRWISFAGWFFLGSIFFLLGTNLQLVNIVADRYMYLPSLGICLLLGYGAQQMFFYFKDRRRFLIPVLIGMICLVLAVMTFQQCRIWKDSLTLWSATIERTSHSWLAFYNRAKEYEAQEKYDLALADSDQAQKLNPAAAVIYNNRAKALLNLGRMDEALKDLETAITLNPQMAIAYNNRGLIHSRMRQFDLAVKDFTQALQIDPKSAALYYYRSMANVEVKHLDEAMHDAVKAKDLGYPGIDDYLEKLKAYVANF